MIFSTKSIISNEKYDFNIFSQNNIKNLLFSFVDNDLIS